jgi:hypothetical protein
VTAMGGDTLGLGAAGFTGGAAGGPGAAVGAAGGACFADVIGAPGLMAAGAGGALGRAAVEGFAGIAGGGAPTLAGAVGPGGGGLMAAGGADAAGAGAGATGGAGLGLIRPGGAASSTGAPQYSQNPASRLRAPLQNRQIAPPAAPEGLRSFPSASIDESSEAGRSSSSPSNVRREEADDGRPGLPVGFACSRSSISSSMEIGSSGVRPCAGLAGAGCSGPGVAGFSRGAPH